MINLIFMVIVFIIFLLSAKYLIKQSKCSDLFKVTMSTSFDSSRIHLKGYSTLSDSMDNVKSYQRYGYIPCEYKVYLEILNGNSDISIQIYSEGKICDDLFEKNQLDNITFMTSKRVLKQNLNYTLVITKDKINYFYTFNIKEVRR